MAGEVFIALYLTGFLSATSTVTGQFVPTLNDNGTTVCPGNASKVFRQFELKQPNGVLECIPSSVLCAWKCSKTRNCTRFNWKEKEKLCELFTYVPLQCLPVSGCVHFQIPNRRPLCGEVSCSNSACTWTDFPMTQIKHGSAIVDVSSADECKCICLADPICFSCTFDSNRNICRKHDSTTPMESATQLDHFQFECP